DPFAVNQFLHPYQGSMYQGFARSAGLGFWESFAYTFLGSALWEEAGEHTTPSVNDQIASGIAGSFLGEPLFRISSLLLESGGGNPGFWRELGAGVISPSTGCSMANASTACSAATNPRSTRAWNSARATPPRCIRTCPWPSTRGARPTWTSPWGTACPASRGTP